MTQQEILQAIRNGDWQGFGLLVPREGVLFYKDEAEAEARARQVNRENPSWEVFVFGVSAHPQRKEKQQ